MAGNTGITTDALNINRYEDSDGGEAAGAASDGEEDEEDDEEEEGDEEGEGEEPAEGMRHFRQPPQHNHHEIYHNHAILFPLPIRMS